MERRTVVVSGVPAPLPPGRMADKLTIHFQSRRRSHGGDVEEVTFPTNMEGVAFVRFEDERDAETVLMKPQHILADEEFPQEYHLTVFPFSADVFLYVPGATLDLSVFGEDQVSLIKKLRSAYRSVRFSRSPHQQGAVTVEGPFASIKALREDLIHRATASRGGVGGGASEEIWVDSYVFKYLKKFHRTELMRCLNGVRHSFRETGSDLVCLSLSETPSGRTLKDSAQSLKVLTSCWESNLIVQELRFQPTAELRVDEVCRHISTEVSDVLYELRNPRVKAIGPFESCSRFCQKLKEQLRSKNMLL